MKVKICGITNLTDALVCIEQGVDALGFIFSSKSKRYINPNDAKSIISQLPAFVMKVGVFVNETSDVINYISSQVGLNAVQLHGDEMPEIISEINCPVIKSFRVNENFDFNILNDYETSHFLLDTYDLYNYGGSGKIFNWDLIPEQFRKKIILAGGVSVDNIEEISTRVDPSAVDVSSSLEEYPGKKDHKRVKKFFDKIKELRSREC